MTARAGRSEILTLAAIAVLGSLATQMIVPALPALAHEFSTTAVASQRVIGVYLAGLATGQLFAGPMADRFGRRPVMVGGLCLFVLGSIGAALAPSLGLLLASRLLQALGGAGGIITARVMVGDLFPAEEVAERQATMMSLVLLSPAVAPVIGGALTEWLGWRPIFALLAVSGLLAGLVVRLRITESRRKAEPQARNMAHAWGLLITTPRFTCHAAAMALASSSLYAFLAATPFLLAREYGIGPRDTGLFLLIVAFAGIVGTKFVGRINREGRGSIRGAAIVCSGGALLLASAVLRIHHLAAFIAPMAIMGFGTGVLGPSTISQIMQSRKGLEGTATSLAGALQMGGSAIASSLIGAADSTRLGLVLTVMTLLALVAAIAGRNAGPAAP
ncbi:MAG: multidrug effflux MFS transporter [Novosphingobium sp.]